LPAFVTSERTLTGAPGATAAGETARSLTTRSGPEVAQALSANAETNAENRKRHMIRPSTPHG
jgi:hypothetical protein